MSLPDSFLPAYPRSLKAFPSLCRAYYLSPSDSVEALPSTPLRTVRGSSEIPMGFDHCKLLEEVLTLLLLYDATQSAELLTKEEGLLNKNRPAKREGRDPSRYQ